MRGVGGGLKPTQKSCSPRAKGTRRSSATTTAPVDRNSGGRREFSLRESSDDEGSDNAQSHWFMEQAQLAQHDSRDKWNALACRLIALASKA